MHLRPRRGTCGFTLIEAMIALIVVAFGLLALAGLQIALSRNADVAKQRTEAVRLAQERMEKMRSYTSIAPVAAPPPPAPAPLAWQDLPSAAVSDPLNPIVSVFSNTSYDRSWTLIGAPEDPMRRASVTVAWTDRAGERQSVQLQSFISNSDPARVGALGFPTSFTTKPRQPNNRNINIPVAATQLDEGRKSVYQFAPDVAMVFNNVSGLIIEKCDTIITNTQDETAHCSPFRAALVNGFVTAAPGVLMPASVPASGPAGMPMLPTGVNTSAVIYDNSGGKTISCVYAVAKDQNSGDNLANAQYYLCAIPITTTGGWSGTLRFGGLPTTGNYKVCRFQYDVSASPDPNQRNVQPYVNVKMTLDNQNYFVENSPGPTCTPPVLSGATAVLHQDCRAAAPPTVINCPGPTDVTPL